MLRKNMIAVSYLKSKFSQEETLRRIDQSNANFIHVDLMDGEYVSNKNFTDINKVVNDLTNYSKMLDIHLMVNNPLQYIKAFKNLNVWCITFHLDSCNNAMAIINLIKSYHIKVGIAIKPKEDVSILDNYLDIIDYVLIMSVEPGKGGQKFDKEIIPKIKYFKTKNVLLGIDGGINEESIKLIKEYNIDNIISGSFICLSDNYNNQIAKLI